VVNGLTLEVVGWAAAFALTLAALFVGAGWVRSRKDARNRRRAEAMRERLRPYERVPKKHPHDVRECPWCFQDEGTA
jgi:hypothetical protein